MNRQQRRFLIGAIVIAVLIIVIAVVNSREEKEEGNTLKTEEYTIEQTNGDKVNTSEALKKARKELDYYVKNITLTRKDAQTVFKIDIENQKTSTIKGQLLDIVFIDKNGEEEARMALYIRDIEAGKTITTQATINNDFTNVYNFKLEKRKTAN